MTAVGGYVLAIDYGTSFTSAAILPAGGRAEVLRVDDDTRFASNVFLDGDGKRLLVGRAAANYAAADPGRYERSPKRHLGQETLILGGVPVSPVAAVAAVLGAVVEEAKRHHRGQLPAKVRLTHPAAWGPTRLKALTEAAKGAGITSPLLVSEPEAAAHFFANSDRSTVKPGDRLAVYDLGGGTFDTAVLECTGPSSFKLAGPPGGTAGDPENSPEIGGEIFDQRVYEYLGKQIAARNIAAWDAIRTMDDRRHREARRTLREDARKAKESLSDVAYASAYVGVLNRDFGITREQFNGLIEADIQTSIAILTRTLEAAGVDQAQLCGLFLAGGSSRIPLVYESVRGHFGLSDTEGDPKAIVALGAATMHAPAKPKPKPKPKPAPVPPKPKPTPVPPKPKPKPKPTPVPPKPKPTPVPPKPKPTPTPKPAPPKPVPRPAPKPPIATPAAQPAPPASPAGPPAVPAGEWLAPLAGALVGIAVAYAIVSTEVIPSSDSPFVVLPLVAILGACFLGVPALLAVAWSQFTDWRRAQR